MHFEPKLARVCFWVGLGVGPLLVGLARLLIHFGVYYPSIGLLFLILFPTTLFTFDLNLGDSPFVEALLVAICSYLNGILYGELGVLASKQMPKFARAPKA